jgi:hypothetical protein
MAMVGEGILRRASIPSDNAPFIPDRLLLSQIELGNPRMVRKPKKKEEKAPAGHASSGTS